MLRGTQNPPALAAMGGSTPPLPAPYLNIFRINNLGELEIVRAQIVPKLCPDCAQLSPHRHRSVRIPYRFPPGWPFIFSAHFSRTSRRTPQRNSQSKGRGWLILTLAGSTVYAFAETLGWRQGLNNKLRQARWFYGLILVSTRVGVGLDFIGINPVKTLYWTAVINGLLAPFRLVAILIVAADKKLMQGQPSSRLGWILVAIATMACLSRASRCLLCSVPTNPCAEVWVPRSSDRGALQQIVQPTNSKPAVAVWFKQDAVLALLLGIAVIFRQ